MDSARMLIQLPCTSLAMLPGTEYSNYIRTVPSSAVNPLALRCWTIRTVAVQASALTELKLRISVASNGRMIDMACF